MSFQTPYSQLLGATTLTKLVNKGSATLTLEQRVEMKNYVLEYLGTHTKLPSYVQQALVQLYARLTKIGWNEGTKSSYPFRSVTQDLGKFLQVCVLVHVLLFLFITSPMAWQLDEVTIAGKRRLVVQVLLLTVYAISLALRVNIKP